MAPLTGIALASNWLINKLSLNAYFGKITKMTINGDIGNPRDRSGGELYAWPDVFPLALDLIWFARQE